MACPTCDHTMESIGCCDGGTVWHCPRCGTVKHHNQSYVPKLVERCRRFERQEMVGCVSREVDKWKGLGIAEAINPPGERFE